MDWFRASTPQSQALVLNNFIAKISDIYEELEYIESDGNQYIYKSDWNKAVNGSETSAHLIGYAVDLVPKDMKD